MPVTHVHLDHLVLPALQGTRVCWGKQIQKRPKKPKGHQNPTNVRNRWTAGRREGDKAILQQWGKDEGSTGKMWRAESEQGGRCWWFFF